VKLRITKDPIPRRLEDHPDIKGLIGECEIRLGAARSRLRAKLALFKNKTALNHFFQKCLGHSYLGRGCHGAVTNLQYTVWPHDKPAPTHKEVDPRYFCLIGLSQPDLTWEVVAHEAVHAAIAYGERPTRNPWDKYAKELPEERICYPAGIIAHEIHQWLLDHDLYPTRRK
jgi:hypothetical protein